MKWFLIALIAVVVVEAFYYQEVQSFKAPLTKDKFDHWDAEGSTVFLKNKIVLAPEGKD